MFPTATTTTTKI